MKHVSISLLFTVIEIHTTKNNHSKHEERRHGDETSIQTQIQTEGLIRDSEPVKQNFNLSYSALKN